MNRARGFTLLELLVAIVITSVVALLAYGTAQTGIDMNDRLLEHRTGVEAQAIVRELLVDALRHPPEGGGAAMNDVLFGLYDATDARGLPTDEIQFLSHGLTSPLGTSKWWLVTLAPTPTGVQMRAAPLDTGRAVPVVTRLPGVHGLNVRVLGRSADSEWQDTWDVLGRVPAAVALEFLTEHGQPAAPALVVHAALESVK